MDISIIFGTYNRSAYLERCVESILRLVDCRTHYEIVVVDGGSSDGSRQFLDGIPECRRISEQERRGAVTAFNTAFEFSRGSLVVTLNDDVEVLSDLSLVLERFDDPKVGQLALAYGHHKTEPRTYRTFTVHGKAYANYSAIRRDVAELAAFVQGGLWNPVYHTYAADTELSCWVWKLGFEVRAQPDIRLIDWEAQDALRKHNNSGRNVEDGKLFHRRWPSKRHLEPDGPMPLVSAEERERYRAVRECVAFEHALPHGRTVCARCGLEVRS